MTQLTLSEIYIYPVKSLSGIRVNSWEVNARGFRYDRHWMLIDRNNRFLSQRQLPSMSQINTSINNGQLILSAPSKNSISTPLNANDGEQIKTAIWQDRCTAKHVSNKIDLWLSDFLQYDCRLVFQTREKRMIDPKYTARGADDHIAFTDGFPFLIISENSLAALNKEMDKDLPMTRFRPNLVISGCNSYAEDYWRNISIGAINFRLPKPCSRCKITTIDNLTAQTHKEPLKTLHRLRKWKQGVYFGQNALHNNSGILSVGDTVTINQTGDPQPPIKKNK